jgi:hypothetical protein
MDEIPALATILVDNERLFLEHAAEKNTTDSRVMVVKRLAWSLGNGITESDCGNIM